jgi:hypothetical protein
LDGVTEGTPRKNAPIDWDPPKVHEYFPAAPPNTAGDHQIDSIVSELFSKRLDNCFSTWEIAGGNLGGFAADVPETAFCDLMSSHESVPAFLSRNDYRARGIADDIEQNLA